MSKWKRSLALPVTLVAIALGVLVSIQVQTQKNVSAAEQINQQRLAQMKTILANLQKENAKLKQEHEDLVNKIDDARKKGGTDPELMFELKQTQIMDGTQAVQGPGIQITIDDRKQNNKVVFPITTDDLTRMINTLKFAGAEAISINGQRVVANTAIVLSGTSTFLVNQVPINRPEGIPYEILAIGDQQTLVDYFSALEASTLKQNGITVSVVRKVVQIPSYKGSYVFNKAQPEKEDSI